MEVEEGGEESEFAGEEEDIRVDPAEFLTMIVKGKAIHVLIDIGSTHNFLDYNTARKLGCLLTAITPFGVSVADGKKVQSNYMCKGLTWKMQGVTFDSDMLILPIGGCNKVLGI
ncbi:hypothetical protein CQW23_09354 [Capsicum baccatum]|uniref:Uncharacterized protein n=1 Tax=Capsicum baccatum TaxID=33114 RepID=A0A2G2WWJ5_CAPBA|nr:hypothetical protein CQW23_09354 [Capsicum baccatum]